MSLALESLGWTTFQDEALRDQAPPSGHTPGRVVRQERGWVWVDTGERQVRAAPSGRLRHRAEKATELPVIGDWVVVGDVDPTDGAAIAGVLRRRTELVRRRAGGVSVAQPVAANVDVALIVVALDREPNLGLIERAVVIARAAGIEPIVILSKADLVPDWKAIVESVRAHLEALEVLAISASTGEGVDAVPRAIGARRTATMLGASGAGKSSLVNRLMGEPVMRTGAVRAGDAKGGHTTTHRQLFVLPGGALLIDGPGVRELGVWGETAAVEEAFPEIVEAAARCVHRACSHQTEARCAVQAELRRGRISPERLADYRKLFEEIHDTGAHRRGRPRNRSTKRTS